ncbi:MAG: hypothetical protein ACREFC_13640 [Stellaceae bacterium]
MRRYALGFPDTREDLPWDESAIKVKGKTFRLMRHHGDGLSLSVKLPQSAQFALDRKFLPADWLGARRERLGHGEFCVEGQAAGGFAERLDRESYRAVAPKKRFAGPAAEHEKKPGKPSSRINERRPSRH